MTAASSRTPRSVAPRHDHCCGTPTNRLSWSGGIQARGDARCGEGDPVAVGARHGISVWAPISRKMAAIPPRWWTGRSPNSPGTVPAARRIALRSLPQSESACDAPIPASLDLEGIRRQSTPETSHCHCAALNRHTESSAFLYRRNRQACAFFDGKVELGSWVLAHLDWAKENIDEIRASQINDALDAVMRGESDLSSAFADLTGREPLLPDFLRGKP